MRRSARWNRPIAACLAIWVALFLGEPSLVHSCPVHDGLAVVAASGHGGAGGMAARMGAMVDVAATSSSAASAAAPEHQHDQHHQPGGHHLCSCPGACSVGGSAASALPGPPTGALVVATWRAVTGVAPEAASLPRLAPPHALPFANGPPAAAAPMRAA